MPPRPRSALPDLVLAHQVGRIFHAKTHDQTSFTFAAQENLCFVPLAFLNADEAFDEAGYAASQAPILNQHGKARIMKLKASDWIAGPTKTTVAQAIHDRT